MTSKGSATGRENSNETAEHIEEYRNLGKDAFVCGNFASSNTNRDAKERVSWSLQTNLTRLAESCHNSIEYKRSRNLLAVLIFLVQ